MKKRIISLAAACALILSLLAGCGSSDTLRIGTGGTGGNYYAFGNALAQILTDNSDLSPEVKATAGSAANLRLLKKGFLQLAIAQSDTLLEAQEGTGAFDEPLTGYSAVASLYTEACQLVVPADSDITSAADLAGKRVSVGEEDSGVVRNAQAILESCGVGMDSITVSYLSFTDSASAMERGELDAFFCTAGAPTTAVSELAKNYGIRLISLDDYTIRQLTGLYSCYSACTIPAGTYEGQTEDVTTIGVTAVLVASNRLSDDVVEQLTSLLFEKSADIQYATSVSFTGDAEFGASAPIAFHSGAAAYYESRGISTAVSAGETTGGVNAGQDD